METEYWVASWLIIGGVIGFLCGKSKGREFQGAVWGTLLGFIGWIVVLAGPDIRRKCPKCFGAIPQGATKCLHCGSEFEAFETSNPNSVPALSADKRAWNYTEISYIETPAGCKLATCPVCGHSTAVEPELLDKGLHCERCGTGFVPHAAKS